VEVSSTVLIVRSQNRRTDIVLTPDLMELYKLIDKY
jgi:hypothetical protein